MNTMEQGILNFNDDGFKLSPSFHHYELTMVEPSFGSSLTSLIFELEHLRRKVLSGSTKPDIFFQLKRVFHILESIGSARIEGNNTTIAEYIDTQIFEGQEVSHQIKEIQNLEKAMKFVETHVTENPIDRAFVSEIHKIIVSDLPPEIEGDYHPGEYRSHDLKISKSLHIPPIHTAVSAYMQELFDFINKEYEYQHDLLTAAIAHHRFAWIHPFGNGNGRTARAFTYAMLVKSGFKVNVGRIINPTAVFCNDRNKYYEHLAKADKGDKDGILDWCYYMLSGLLSEILKIDKLLDYEFLTSSILYPAIHFSHERQYITELEAYILHTVVEKQVIKANDIREYFPNKRGSDISRMIRSLRERKMLTIVKGTRQKYTIRFDNNYLLRGIMESLGNNGFLPKDTISNTEE